MYKTDDKSKGTITFIEQSLKDHESLALFKVLAGIWPILELQKVPDVKIKK